jgi:hypothetical protein
MHYTRAGHNPGNGIARCRDALTKCAPHPVTVDGDMTFDSAVIVRCTYSGACCGLFAWKHGL